MKFAAEDKVAAVREQVGAGRVLCGLSGGVGSSAAAALVQRAVGDQLTCVFVDHGLLRSLVRAPYDSVSRMSQSAVRASVLARV